MIIDELLGRTTRKYTLISLFEQHNKMMEAAIGTEATRGNYKNFKTSLKYLKEFVNDQYQSMDLPLIKVSEEFITGYSLFLQTKKQCHHNGAVKQLQRLKKVLNIGVSKGWLLRNPFSNHRLKFESYDRIILNQEELQAIEKLSGLSPKLQLTTDAFLFACWTGLSYVDTRNLKQDNIVKGIDNTQWIITRRQKSNVKARIPLLPQALMIIDKYKSHPKLKEKHVIPIFSNQKTNDYLKEIARKAAIDKPLSFSVGRHVFATVITLSNGVPIETVSKALGHTSIRTTQIYSRVVDEKIAADFAKLRNVLDKSQPDEGSHNP
jgi:site-specific recombinase XerD